MKSFFKTTCYVIFVGLCSLVLPVVSQAAPLSLAVQPLSTQPPSPILPNILFVLDDSGSMAATHMPDAVDNFVSDYGYQSSQCNGVYYNPTITYNPPIRADLTYYPNASFTAARDDGFDTSTSARNLNSEFYGNRFEPAARNTATNSSYLDTPLGLSGALYYEYTGTVTDKNYNSTTSTFYTECNTAIGGAAPFAKRRLATTITTPFLVNTATGANYTSTITVTGGSSTTVNSVTVNGVTITTGSAAGSSNNNTAAANLKNAIGLNGFSASNVSGTNVVTITGPASAVGFTPVVIKTGSDAYASTAFTGSTVNLQVNGVAIMSSPAVIKNGDVNTTAANIAAKITSNGFSASVNNNLVTITGPATASNYMPIVTLGGGGTLSFATDVFPDSTAAKLTNFANWYSYYRTRMLTMKTAAGLAFADLNGDFRVGLMQINSGSGPLVENGPFLSTKRSDWYTTFYAAEPTVGTPLREALSNAGKYYAGNNGTDPVQYSCQQNFTILSTDGYWNGNDGSQLDGSAIGNQDGTDDRPFSDGSVVGSRETTIETRQVYNATGTRITALGGSNCSGGKKRTINTTWQRTCNQDTPPVGPVGAYTCGGWSSVSSAYASPFTSNSSTCVNSPSVPATTNPVAVSSSTSDAILSGGTSDTLADVAEYYYNTDLRPGTCTLCEDNVFISATDSNAQQHMTTFTLGLGANGRMKYKPDYAKPGVSADYDAVKNGLAATATVCNWQTIGTTCTWPTPGSNNVENIDDLWHAAVNGRGTYFSADNPETLASSLTSALKGIDDKKGAASAAATSTLNPVAGNNAAFVASYINGAWTGNLESRSINTETGVVTKTATWCAENVPADVCKVNGVITSPVAQTTGGTTIYNCETPVATNVACGGNAVKGWTGNTTGTAGTEDVCKVQVAQSCTGTLASKVSALSDTRLIYTANTNDLPATGKVAGTELIQFNAAYATANPSYFDQARIETTTPGTGLKQWNDLDSTQRANAVGLNLLNYLRGQYGYEDRLANADVDKIFRKRDAILGDALESVPAFIANPVFSYPYTAYDLFKADNVSRAGAVYVGANDGMLHAFNSATGAESWAYVPSMVIPNMWKLASSDYFVDGHHVNFVNGSPIITDVCSNPCTAKTDWKTILVAGLNGGGRGYFALDITVPTSPKLLWEFTTTAGIGKTKDDDLGYSYGQPVITRKNDGTWVVMVTSGYNNVSPGDGGGHLFVLNALTGAKISKISTGVGSASDPSGLGKIATYNTEPPGNAAGYTYGGDLRGNLWRFNINDCNAASPSTCTFMKFAELYSNAAGTQPQPITTTPVLGKVSGKRVIYIGTGMYLQASDVTVAINNQSQYALQDDDLATTWVNPRNTLVVRTLTTNVTAGTRSVSAAATSADFTKGWYVDWPGTNSQERVNIDAKLVQGVLFVPSLVPSSSACSPGGIGWLNYFDYRTGGEISSTHLSGIKFDSAIVGLSPIFIDGETKIIIRTEDGKDVIPDIDVPKSEGVFSGKRTLWRELTQ